MSKIKMTKQNYTVMVPIFVQGTIVNPGCSSRTGYPINVVNGKAKVTQQVFNILKMTAKSEIEEEFGFELVIDDGELKTN